MCDQHGCSAAALHAVAAAAAAERQQLKASWGVAAETQASRKKEERGEKNKEIKVRVSHAAGGVNTKYLKSSDESWVRRHLPSAPNDSER